MATHSMRKKVYKRRKAYLITVFGEECFYCGVRVYLTADDTSARQATLDHIIPVSAGGDDSHQNLLLACRKCNTAKLSTSFEDFIQKCTVKMSIIERELFDRRYELYLMLIAPKSSSRYPTFV